MLSSNEQALAKEVLEKQRQRAELQGRVENWVNDPKNERLFPPGTPAFYDTSYGLVECDVLEVGGAQCFGFRYDNESKLLVRLKDETEPRWLFSADIVPKSMIRRGSIYIKKDNRYRWVSPSELTT